MKGSNSFNATGNKLLGTFTQRMFPNSENPFKDLHKNQKKILNYC